MPQPLLAVATGALRHELLAHGDLSSVGRRLPPVVTTSEGARSEAFTDLNEVRCIGLEASSSDCAREGLRSQRRRRCFLVRRPYKQPSGQPVTDRCHRQNVERLRLTRQKRHGID